MFGILHAGKRLARGDFRLFRLIEQQQRVHLSQQTAWRSGGECNSSLGRGKRLIVSSQAHERLGLERPPVGDARGDAQHEPTGAERTRIILLPYCEAHLKASPDPH